MFLVVKYYINYYIGVIYEITDAKIYKNMIIYNLNILQ